MTSMSVRPGALKGSLAGRPKGLPYRRTDMTSSNCPFGSMWLAAELILKRSSRSVIFRRTPSSVSPNYMAATDQEMQRAMDEFERQVRQARRVECWCKQVEFKYKYFDEEFDRVITIEKKITEIKCRMKKIRRSTDF